MLSPRQNKALQALLTSPTKTAAAKSAGITMRTLQLYLKDPEFQDALQSAYRPMLAEATRQAQQALSPALEAMRTIIGSDEAKNTEIIAAARTVLEYGLKLTEYNDILPKLEELEDANRDHKKTR